MNKYFSKIIFAALLAFSLTACNSMESDAKKVAKGSYEVGKIYKNPNDRTYVSPEARDRNEKKARAHIAYANKMLEKYGKDTETREKFNTLVNKELAKLKKNEK